MNARLRWEQHIRKMSFRRNKDNGWELRRNFKKSEIEREV
jgi:hypothetical protein